MNRKRVEEYLPIAYKEISNVGISQHGKVNKSYRGQISSLGAAISTGSLLAAIAYYSQDKENGENNGVKRTLIIDAVYQIIEKTQSIKPVETNLFNYVASEIKKGNERAVKELITDCAIAIKLALNLYELCEEG